MLLDKHKLKIFHKKNCTNKSQKVICNAPFCTLTFTQFGKIISCFQNKNIELGTYYNGIDYFKLWQSSELITLRKKIKNYDLSYGCYGCKENILKKNDAAVYLKRYDFLHGLAEDDQPISLEFQISNICNFNCIMCNGENSVTIRKSRECRQPYSSYYDESFPSSLIPLLPRIKKLSFSGGEPFIIKQYREIIRIALEINPDIEFSFSTNASMFSESDFAFFQKNNVKLTISYESIIKETFESIRKNSHFETVHQNLLRANDIILSKGDNITVKICPMLQNIQDIPQTFDFLNSRNIRIMFNTVLFPPETALWINGSKTLTEIAEFLAKYEFEANNQIQQSNCDAYKDLISQIIFWKNKSIEREQIINSRTIDYNNLLNLFMKNMRDYLKKNNLHFENDYFFLLKEQFENFNNDLVILNTLYYFYILPIYFTISEMNFRHPNIFTERISQVKKYFEYNSNLLIHKL